MALSKVAAIINSVITLGVVVFQIALASGAPWGAYAMGGAAPGRFPPSLRAGAIVQGLLLAGMAVVILARAGLILPGWQPVVRWLVWVVVALTAISLVLNLLSTSAGERAIWLPTLAILLISSLIVAISRTPAASAP